MNNIIDVTIWEKYKVLIALPENEFIQIGDYLNNAGLPSGCAADIINRAKYKRDELKKQKLDGTT